MPAYRVRDDEIELGRHFRVSFQRTLRIPDDGHAYPLPPGLGRFPVCRVRDYAHGVPDDWRALGGVFIPMYQREALWLAFDGAWWRPNAVQVAVGGINAVSGRTWKEALTARPQNYLVCPDQPWLDGIKAGKDTIRQFVAVPLGSGFTVEAQLTGREELGGLQIRVYQPKPGRFPDRPPPQPPRPERSLAMEASIGPSPRMGLGAGGAMRQKVYPDRYGIDTWDASRADSLFVHIVNSQAYQAITGRPPPPSPIDAAAYTRYGFPWFDLYDEHLEDVAASKELAGVAGVQELGKASGGFEQDESLEISDEQVVKFPPAPPGGKSGKTEAKGKQDRAAKKGEGK